MNGLLQGTLWVTDFGLAKAADTDDLTHSGDVVGTLRYLAPERFDGPGDHRADVYSLGLTLYELLTLRPAFAAEVRARLVEQVLAASPPRPRSVNPAIPRDLETVVLKATARDPAMRYPSAAELADDLRRFVQDRPIQARRASAFEQTWRWCRRNPVVASLLAAVVLITAGGFAATTYHAAKADAAARRADENAAQAEERADEVQREKRAQEALNQQLRVNQQELRRTLYSAHLNQAQSAWQGENYTRVLDLLEHHRPKTDEPDLRGFEWHYWKRQAHREIALFRLPSDRTTALPRGATTSAPLALSNDGARVVSHSSQGLQVWDVATGRRLTHCPELKPVRGLGPGGLRSRNNNLLLFSPDGRRVATVALGSEEEDEDGLVTQSRARIVFVEVESGRELYPIDLNVRATGRGLSLMMDFSPDGKLFAVGRSQVAGPRGAKAEPTTIAVHDLTAGKQLFQESRPDIVSLSWVKFRPDGRQLSIAGISRDERGTTRFVLDATTGAVLPDAPIDEGPVGTRSPDGRRWVTQIRSKAQRGRPVSSTITVTADGKELWKGSAPNATTAFRFSPDGKRLVGYATSSFARAGGNSAIRVWNADTGDVLPVHIVLSEDLVEVAFRPDGKLVTLDAGAVKTWDLALPPLVPMVVALAGPGFLMGGASVTPDGRFCVSTVGYRLTFGENPAEKIDEPERAVLVLAEPGREVLRVPMKGAGDNARSSIGPITALSANGSVLAIRGRLDPDREKEAAKAPPLMTLWNVATREMIGRIESPAKANEREAFGVRGGGITLSPDGRLVAYAGVGARANPVRAEASSTITVWDVATRKPRHSIEVKAATASSLGFSPDGRRLAVVARSGPVFGGDSAAFVQVFDLASGSEVRKFDVPFFTIPSVQYSPDGKWLAVYSGLGGPRGRGRGRDSSPQLWPAEGGGGPVELTGSTTLIRDLAFSPDAQRVAVLSGSLNSRSEVKVWDPRTGRELLSLPVDQVGNEVRFSADGQALYVFTPNGRLAFDATALSPEAEASDVADRLTPAETREQIAAEIDQLTLSKELKARVAELARPVPNLRSRTRGPGGFSRLQAGLPESEYKALLAQYEERVKTQPKSYLAWGYLGGAQYRLGKYEEALQSLLKAEELTTEAQREWRSQMGISKIALLAMTQHRLGRADEAKATLAKAREAARTVSPPSRVILDEAEALIEPKK